VDLYLTLERAFRSEASALPKFFIASASKEEVLKSAQDKNTGSATPGLWSSLPAGFSDDEAYIAPAEANKITIASPQDALPEAQAICYDLLRHRFRLLRSTLRCTPSAAAIAALDDSHPISLPRHHEAARKEWRRLILSVDPRMAQLACMDSHSVLGALGIVARELSEVVRSENAESIRRMGAWTWGILGKCRDVGELATEEVGAIRDLGKRAVRIFEKIGEANNQFPQDGPDSDTAEDNQTENEAPQDDPEQEVMQQVEVVGTDDSDIPDATNESDDLEAAKARLQAQLQGDMDNNRTDDASAGDKEYMIQLTRAMLDMILTVVGEFFGQRDLLEARQIWVS
jgi:regulator of vacuolar morphogenesis